MTDTDADPRFQYFVSLFSNCLDAEKDTVETVMIGGEETVNKFIQGDAQTNKLFFSAEMELGTSSEILKTTGVYVFRLENKEISKKLNQLSDQIIAGSVNSSDSVENLYALVKQVYTPIFNDTMGWGKANQNQVNEFMNSVEKFSEKLGEVINSKTPQVILEGISEKFPLDAPLERIRRSNVSEATREHYEGVVIGWTKKVKQIIMEKKNREDEGPRSEIRYWEDRYSKLNSVIEQLKEREKKKILAVVKKQVNKDWKDMNIKLTDEANEAKDNVKYLGTLEKYIEPLYGDNALRIIETLPGLLKNIAMIHSISRYYSTKERMTDLFVKITTQMIQNCTKMIRGGGNIWNQDTGKLIENLNMCIRLNEIYQKCYRIEKEKLATNSKGKQFDFDYLTIFGQFNLFCSRIRTLGELFSTIEQFKAFKEHNIDGMERLIHKFFEHVDDLKKKSSNPLDYRKNTFDKEFNQFSKKIAHLEQSLQVFINTSFEYISSSENALKMLKRFQSILKRESLRNELQNKYTVIFHNYGLQLETVQKIYERYNQDPLLVRNSAPVSGNVMWARQLIRRIEEPMKKFRDIPQIMKSGNSRKIIRTYNKVLKALFKFEQLWIDAWKENLHRCQDGMRATLLVKDNGKYFVNFDPEIIELIKETKTLMRINVKIEEEAQLLLLQEERLKRQRDKLRHLLEEKYVSLIDSINPILLNLMKSHINKLEIKLQPGLFILTWTSMNIDLFINNFEKELNEFSKIVEKINSIIENRIERNVETIKEIIFIPKATGMFSCLDDFYSSNTKYIEEMKNVILIKNHEIELAVEDILATLNSSAELEDGKKLVQFFKDKVTNSILVTIVNSILELKQIITPYHKNKIAQAQDPIFKIILSLNKSAVGTSISIKPTVPEVDNVVTNVISNIVGITKDIKLYEENSLFDLIKKDKKLFMILVLYSGSIYCVKKKFDNFVNNFQRYYFLWEKSKQEDFEKFTKECGGNPVLEDFEIQLKKYTDIETEILSINDNYVIDNFSFDLKPLKKALCEEARDWKKQFAQNLHRRAKKNLNDIVDLIEEYGKKLDGKIESLDELAVMMNILEQIRDKSSVMADFRIRRVMDQYNMLKKYKVLFVKKAEIDRVYDLHFIWTKLTKKANTVQEKIAGVQNEYKKKLIEAIAEFKVDVVTFRKDFEQKGPMEEGIEPPEAIERLKKFKRLFDERKRKFETYNNGEKLFGFDVSEYPQLEKTEKELEYLEKLYSLYIVVTKQIKSYEDVLWSDLNFDDITKEIEQYQKDCTRLPKQLRQWKAYSKLEKLIADFLELQPILSRLSDSSVRKRHWEKIEVIIGESIIKKIEDEVFKLKDIVNTSVLDHKEEIEEISLASKKEEVIENKLKQIEADWKDYTLTFAEYRNRGFLVLKGMETTELMEKLEDTQMIVGSLMSSRYLEPFRSVVQTWMKKLTSVSETLEQWLRVQSLWMYLEAVFTAPDIRKQLFSSAKKFASIDKSWVKIMTNAQNDSRVLNFCYENELLKNLPYCQQQLEECQKSLSGYLGKKRNDFPRFYFISDEVLLTILSRSSDPHAIQDHLLLIFDSIAKLKFDTVDQNKVLEMHSAQGEVVPFNEPFVAKGNVEEWLGDLEANMVSTIKENIRRVAMECSSTTVSNLVKKYNAQMALIGLQFLWTLDCEEAIMKTKTEKKAMDGVADKHSKILRKLSEMAASNLSDMERTKIETLIIIQVHQVDVSEYLIKHQLKDLLNFEWQRQIRFYWRKDQDSAVVKVADVDLDYCYEYLGVKGRLVITPLTDRCYMTLAQALGMKLGGAPAGPAGTGKTETVKDFGNAVGKLVMVFNCSDQMDFNAMGKIYKGLAQSGAWGDFDEFNRIKLEVLSVVGQQIQTIFTAQREFAKSFVFTDGQECALRPGVGIFITMNPGYKGRQDLPENLKIQFRLVSMMKPDREIIIRVLLSSCGYKDNTKLLAKKFNTLYGLCEQQLSKQPHYDFGLRNILSVLRTAGSTKRQAKKEKEIMLIMSTLKDMNMSKLVSEDVNLFLALLRDLFPGVKARRRSFKEIEEKIKEIMKKNKMTLHKPHIEKIIQLYETSLVRHGIMVVGPSGAGKTTCFNVLLQALTDLGTIHKEYRMNPKAISDTQMFGRLLENEWTDGIFSALWKKANVVFTESERKQTVWIVCDGPVDSIWIENLNTVLDDNRLLTLANGDRIKMRESTKMCFEVEDLRNANPSTVSRAGQIYMSADVLGWKPVIFSKILGRKEVKKQSRNDEEDASQNQESSFSKDEISELKNMFQTYFDDGLKAIEKMKPVIEIPQINLANTCFEIFSSVYADFKGKNDSYEMNKNLIEKLFLFSFIWSLGGLLKKTEREKFSFWILEKFPKDVVPQLSNTTVYDYYIDVKSEKWTNWHKLVPQWNYPENDKIDFGRVFIPTADSTRTHYLIEKLHRRDQNILMCGAVGTAKTVSVEKFLEDFVKKNDSRETFKKINFSSATTPNLFQKTVESCIEKRFRAYGPPSGKHMTIFIDDISMPEYNEWGDQVTNEIVRQIVESSGFYSLQKPGDWILLEDFQYISSMCHPGGGKNDLPSRCKRHFSILNVTLPSKESIDKILNSIILGRYNSKNKAIGMDVIETAGKLTDATINIWKSISLKLLPTPSKFHYLFNLRDLLRVYQGVMLCPSTVIKTGAQLFSLWKNECSRVFSDRLNSTEDKDWYEDNFNQITKKLFSEETVLEKNFFVNFLREDEVDEDTGEVINEVAKIYEPCNDSNFIREKIQKKIEEYNIFEKIKKLDLVLFEDAVAHLIRITRILSMKKGNALLVGYGGSGKQSLTRLAAFINGHEVRQITLQRNFRIADFLEFVQELYKISGLNGQSVVFLLTDNEIKDENFLEYTNMILSSGEIPGLFAKEDLDIILNDLRTILKKEDPALLKTNDTQEGLYKFFIERVIANLHIVLSFSPASDKFRKRAQKFPALFSGCTVDWFFPWPEVALVKVGKKYLSDYNIHCSDETREMLYKFMAYVHSSQSKISDEYFDKFRKRIYSTPQSFLNFINLFKEVYGVKYDEMNENAEKVNRGLEKINTAEDDVKKLRIDLKEKERNLEIAKKQTDVLLDEINQKKEIAGKKADEVGKIRDSLLKDKREIEEGKNEAEQELAAAKPALDDAVKAIESIKPGDINLIKSYTKPAFLIRYVMDCVLILFNIKISPVIRVLDKNKNSVIQTSWDLSLKLLKRDGFLKKLIKFDKDALTDEMIELLEPYLVHPDFNYEKCFSVSEATAGICKWVLAMKTYQIVAKDVKPKMAKLKKWEKNLENATKKLEVKEKELDTIQSRLDAITQQYEAALKKKLEFEKDARKTQAFLEKADNLIQALQGEKTRWTASSIEFKEQINRLIGDVCLSSAFISYCGPYNQEFRQKMLNKYFYQECEQRKIPVTNNLDVCDLLTDESQRGTWSIEGLASDDHSIQNAIMVTKSTKFPLLIDPQEQGFNWLTRRNYILDDKKEEVDTGEEQYERKLMTTTFQDKRFRQRLEECMENGNAMIIENVGEELDPVMNPVLEQHIITTGKIKQIMIQNEAKDYDDHFELYLTTKLSRPSFSPELFAKTTVIDFGVTMKGLEEQLLAYVIQKEKYELEEQREQLMKEVNENQKKIIKYESELLRELSQSQGNLLKNKKLIESLARTKKASQEVQEKLALAEESNKRISAAREEYRPVAIRGSVMYFVMVEMSLVNPMYQTSLSQFYQLFDESMKNAPKAPLASKRIKNITDTLTLDIWKYVGLGLFKRHKFLYTLLLVCKILLRDGKISHEEFHTFLQGGAALDINQVEKKQQDFLDDEEWKNIIAISNRLDVFKELPQMINRSNLWEIFHMDESPEKQKIPEINDKLTDFERMILIRSIRPDRMIIAAHEFIEKTLGEEFVSPVGVILKDIYDKSSNCMPIVCLLSSGSDPTNMIQALSKKQKVDFNYLSMGQGQEASAKELIKNGFENGGWVLLQNCHLGMGYVSTLEAKIINANKAGTIHPGFRLWITCEPHPEFPIGLLQMSIKITLEGDVGLKANMKASFDWVTQDMLDASTRPCWKPLLYTLCFMNSILVERKKFGAVGWNIPYEFNYSDLTSSLAFLQNHFASIGDNTKKGPQISWKTLKYMICQVHYGGKVTDDFDRLYLTTLGDKWLSSVVSKPSFNFYSDKEYTYKIPAGQKNNEEKSLYLNEIVTFPGIDKPAVFGLHENADIQYRMEQSRSVLNTIIMIQPKESSDAGGESREEMVKRLANDYITKLPEDFTEVRELLKKRQGKKKEPGPLLIVLRQEIARLQKLISCVRYTLKDLILAIDGTITMSAKLQNTLDCLYNAIIPEEWEKLSWYNQTLGRWFTELIKRHKQLDNWLKKSRPDKFWLTGFFNPQGFLTAVVQEVARNKKAQAMAEKSKDAKNWALDNVTIKTDVTTMEKKAVSSPPEEGVYIYGLFLQGAGWNKSKCKLKESAPKECEVKLPVVHVTAVSKQKKRRKVYKCPVYKTARRNFDANHPDFVMTVDLNSGEQKPSHWIMRGVALLLKTDT